MLRDPLIAAVRTGCAALVTFLVAWLANTLGAEFPADTATQLQAFTFVVAIGLVNLVVNYLSARVHPLFGMLLGVPKEPAYNGGPAGDHGVTVIEVCILVITACVIVTTFIALGWIN